MAGRVRVEIAVFVLLVVLPAAAGALPPLVRPFDEPADREALLELERGDGGGAAASHPDTVWFGGSGTGDGSVARGGTWTWEADSGEPPRFFPDGDPVGNEFRDGWTFEDQTARSGSSQTGAGHWRADGNYDFDFDGGAFAHRAATHANDGADDGPDPLAGTWSVWIGTNLYLNPEHCGWGRTAGYGDGWSQGIAKLYRFRDAPGPGEYATPAPGSALALSFFHRYATESGFDTCRVEVSWDGVTWERAGSGFSGGTRSSPLPAAGGGAATVSLVTWPGGEGDLHVRLRLASDSFYSDEGEGGDFLFAWQVDDVRLRVNGTPIDLADFESGMGGWEPRRFEGRDVLLTGDPALPAGRISPLATLACDFGLGGPSACPEQCGIERNVLFFFDRDDCDPSLISMSMARSPAFAIGGAAHPDLEGDAGRLIRLDLALDAGSGVFDAGFALCFVYSPSGRNRCPYAPPGGAPGAGSTFDWSRTGFATCDFFSTGVGPNCINGALDDVSANLPAEADSVIVYVGALTQCRDCPDPDDASVPIFDNVRLGVFDPGAAVFVSSSTPERYADSFPTADGDIVTTTARMDGAHSFSMNLGYESPLRWVRSDSAAASCGRPGTAVVLRFRVTPGPCQPNLDHPFFAAYPPGAWHEARMDTGRTHGTGSNAPGTWMTCFHESDPRNGTHWTGTPPAVEPCDDILPDGLFTPGTTVHYFYESRDAATGEVLATFPRARGNRAVGTAENYEEFWLESTVLPALDPACTGAYATNLLVVSDYQTNGVPGAGTLARDRLTTVLSTLGLDFDVYDCVGTNFTLSYNGIGRRDDRAGQQPRPPYNGATAAQLAPYDCIWYYAGLLTANTLSDQTTFPAYGGQPSNDQQRLEGWIAGCTDGDPRLLVLEGLGWASDIDANTTHGPAFLARFGVDVLASDYAQELAANDARRCARLTGTAAAPDFAGEVYGSGCPEDFPLDVFAAIDGGEAVANFVESLEHGGDPVNCADDVNRPAWHALVRKMNPAHACERSVAMSFPFTYLYPLNCIDECLFDDFVVNGANAQLVADLFAWAGRPVNAGPIGVGGAGAAPRFANVLGAARPNPAAVPGPSISYAVAERGRVTLRVFDVSGRLVRALVDQVEEPGSREVKWDGRDAAGRRAGAGVYFYELRAPGFGATRKLVMMH